MFDQWMEQNQKLYASEQEKSLRFNAFTDNFNFINAENAKEGITYTVGLTRFADLTNEEFRALYTNKNIKSS